MIGSMISVTENGYYESADKIISMSAAVFSAFNSVLMPKIANLIGKSRKQDATYYFELALESIMCIAIAIAFGIIAVAKEFVPIFYGPGYDRTIVLMGGLGLGIPFLGWAHIYRSLYLIPSGYDQVYVKSTIYGAITNLVLNMLLIPRLYAMGAVIATVVSEAFIAFFQTYLVRNKAFHKEYMTHIGILVLFGIIMSIVVRAVSYVLPANAVGLVVEVIIGGVIYAILTYQYLIRIRNPIACGLRNKIRTYIDKDA